jgi:hypothetical protein
MTKTLKQAIEQLATLPAQAQEKIGDQLLLHIEKTQRLTARIEAAIKLLDRGDKRELDMNDIIKRARVRYGEV